VLTSTTYLVMAAHPSVKFRDLKGMIDFVKANPGKLNVTGVTLGSTGHLAFAMLNQKYGIDLTMTHYKAITQSYTDVVNGTVDVIILGGSAKPMVDSGKLVAIAVTSPKRWEFFPNTPTFVEAGVPELNFGGWYGVIAPAGVPAEVVAQVNQAFNAAIDMPEIKTKHVAFGMSTLGSTPAEFTQHIRSEQERWGPLIRKLSLTFE
jgi:tripartite-type tricarboxylate transporter receptor subunit TctC